MPEKVTPEAWPMSEIASFECCVKLQPVMVRLSALYDVTAAWVYRETESPETAMLMPSLLRKRRCGATAAARAGSNVGLPITVRTDVDAEYVHAPAGEVGDSSSEGRGPVKKKLAPAPGT